METAEPDEDTLETIRSVCREHDVSLCVLFGSAAAGQLGPGSDLDIGVEFDTLRPGSAEHAERFLRLRTVLDDDLDRSVDLVDIHTMEPKLITGALADCRVLLGSEERVEELLEERGEPIPPAAESIERIETAVRRMREGSP